MITKEQFFKKYHETFQKELKQNASSYCLNNNELQCQDCFYNGKNDCITDLKKDFLMIIRKAKLEKLLK